MDLSGSIQVVSGTCHGGEVLVFRANIPWQDLWFELRYQEAAVSFFEAEVLRIKEQR